MRIYFFNAENGIYEGESFEDADKLDYIEGVTSIAPPYYEHDQIPVFDKERNAWGIVQADTAANHASILQSGKTSEQKS